MPGTHPTDFANFGLRHSLEDLAKAHKTIHLLPTEAQAEYADAVCRANVHEKWVWEDLEVELRRPVNERLTEMTCWNATSVGNLAYIALHAPNSNAQTNARKLLKEYRLLRKFVGRAFTVLWVVASLVSICLGGFLWWALS